MFNAKQIFRAVSAGVISILLIISTAQAASSNNNSRSKDKAQASVSQKKSTDALGTQQKGRSENAAQKPQVNKSQSRSNSVTTTARKKVEQNVDKPVSVQKEKAGNVGSAKSKVSTQGSGQSKAAVKKEEVRPLVQQSKTSTPTVKRKPAEQVKKETVAQPTAKPIQKTQPRIEQRKTSDVVVSKPAVNNENKKNETRIVAPAGKSVEQGKNTTRSRVVQRTAQPTISERPVARQTVSTPTISKSGTQKIISRPNERRERVIRGTGGNEIAIPNTGNLINAEKAVTAVDAHSSRTVTRNDTTIVKREPAYVTPIAYTRGSRSGNSSRSGHSSHSYNSGHSYNSSHSGYYRPIVYHHGHHSNVSYYYSNYHRRYVFVSVGGYWPDYTYTRYYWYGYHPWYWYGAAPVAYPIAGDTYNYYTYDNGSNSNGGALIPGTVINGVEVPDYDALHAAGGRQIDIPAAPPPQEISPEVPAMPQPEQPAAPTESDRLFDEGVKAFGDANYPVAIEKFQRAVRLEPNDMILPFAYAQALFANNNYEQAAAVIHTVLNLMAPAKPEVFFPRGLYKDDNVLTSQIKNLEKAVLMNPSNPELQLLYGYQLLGIGKLDEAKVPLEVAKKDKRTSGPATSLLNLIENVKKDTAK